MLVRDRGYEHFAEGAREETEARVREPLAKKDRITSRKPRRSNFHAASGGTAQYIIVCG